MITVDTRTIPSVPGIYYFRDSNSVPVYIGKAKDIKQRIVQHLADTKNPKESRIREASVSVDWRETNSEFEALLLEANLIKKYQPRYNIDLKDDRSAMYIVITKEELPRVRMVRERELQRLPHKYYFGPLQGSRMARFLIRYLRAIIPFCTDKGSRRKSCFYSQIGLCDPCPAAILHETDPKKKLAEYRHYRRSIARLQRILSGKGRAVLRVMAQDMQRASRNEEFEYASVIRDRIERFEALFQKRLLFDDRLEDPLFIEGVRYRENVALQKLLNLPELHRLECYDISTFSGKQSVASMVVFIDGNADKSHYRRFRIRGKSNFDPDMLLEVLLRRFKHNEWPRADLLVIDGGGPQLRTIYPTLAAQYPDVPAVIGIAKHPDRILQVDPVRAISLDEHTDALHYVQRVRDEAHRFAKRYHVSLRDKVSLGKK